MNYTIEEIEKIKIGVGEDNGVQIIDVNTGLDFMMSFSYETGCDRIVISKEIFAPPFFDLKTKLLGEFLQKAVNYHMKIAIYGDFSVYESKALRDFIVECNRGTHIYFGKDKKDCLKKLSSMK